MCHAIHYLFMLTQVRLRIALSLICVYSISVSTITMALLVTGKEQMNGNLTRGLLCQPDTVEQHMGFPRAAAVFCKILGPFTLLLCLLVYVFFYLRMYQDARNAMLPFNAVNTAARKTVLFYCSMLFLQLLPLIVKVLWDTLWEVEGTRNMMPLSSQSQGARKAKPPHSATAAVLHVSLVVFILVPP